MIGNNKNLTWLPMIVPLALFAVVACSQTGGGGLNIPTTQAAPNPGGTPTPSSSPVPTNQNTVVCPSSITTAGTDVDDNDNDINWSLVAGAENEFAFIKATEGITFVNPDFDSDWLNAKSAGLIRSAYHYFHPGDDPVQAANAFLSTIGALDDGDMAPMLDWEVTDGVSNATAIANAQTWLDTVEAATGRTPIIYVDPTFYTALGNPAQFARYPLYVADYLVNCPTVPAPWKSWVFWQYSPSGTTPGITGATDMDVFNGSMLQLSGFAVTGTM